MSKEQLKIGDMVAFKAKFLKDICDFSKTSADKRGKIIKIEDFGDGFLLAHVENFNSPVNIKNLCKVGSAAYGDNSHG